jgi:hypothetical protein
VAASEREPVVCRKCEARYRHPRLALLLSAMLPGLGSLAQRRYVWGAVMLLAGSGAFLWTLWRMAVHLQVIAAGSSDLVPLLQDAALGMGLVMLSYGLDVAVVWLLRNRLQRA